MLHSTSQNKVADRLCSMKTRSSQACELFTHTVLDWSHGLLCETLSYIYTIVANTVLGPLRAKVNGAYTVQVRHMVCKSSIRMHDPYFDWQHFRPPTSTITFKTVASYLPLCNLRFADDIDLLADSDEELQQLTERLEKTCCCLRHGNKIRQKQNSRQSIKRRQSTKIMDNWKNAERSVPVQILRLHTNQIRNIIKGSEDQTGACTLSHDKARHLQWKNNAISFPTKIKLYKSVVRRRPTKHHHYYYYLLSMETWAECWRRIWRDESRPFKTNATEECLA